MGAVQVQSSPGHHRDSDTEAIPGCGTPLSQAPLLATPDSDDIVNPYEPSVSLPRYKRRPSIVELLQARLINYVDGLIEHSANVATSKHVTSFTIHQGMVGALIYGVYQQVHFSSLSLSECPNLTVTAGTLAVLLLCSAAESGIVLLHRTGRWLGGRC